MACLAPFVALGGTSLRERVLKFRFGASPRLRESTLWVVGAPRSGTSAVTRVLTLLGADAGDPEGHLKQNPELNPHGYFEQTRVIAVNDNVLALLGGHVRFPPPVAPGWERDARLDSLREAATVLLEELFDGAGPPVIKDPRLSLTLPFWLPLAGRPRVVVCVRDPAEALASQDRNFLVQVDRGHLARRWLVYTASALATSAHVPRVLIRYDDLLSHPAAEVERLAQLLDEQPPEGAVRAAAASIEPGLRHHRGGDSELPERGRLLYDALSTGDPETALDRATGLARTLLDAERESFDWERHARWLAAGLGAAVELERELRSWIENREGAIQWHAEQLARLESGQRGSNPR